MFYLIKETLEECTIEAALSHTRGYVGVLTKEEWDTYKEHFETGIDLPLEIEGIHETKAEVNFDSLTGSFYIPERNFEVEAYAGFAYALDERGIIFIDNSHTADKYIQKIQRSRKWRFPSLERFLYDFLECIVAEDVKFLSDCEDTLDRIEGRILKQENDAGIVKEINDIRWVMLEMRNHYEQLIDLGQELEENENEFFVEENLRYFHMFTVRVERLRDSLAYLREYSLQLRDLYQTQLDVKQNKTMAVLTVLTTVFFPLSIITGWYGMNFVHMPELAMPWAYPTVIGLSILIVVVEIIWFKKKKYW